MEESNVIDIHTREPVKIPAAEESEFVRDWQDYVGDTLESMHALMDAETEEEFKARMADVHEQVKTWPV